MEKIVFLTIVISLIAGSCTHEEKSPTAGAWQMVYGKWGSIEKTYPDQIIGSGTKLWTKDCFSFIVKFQMDTVVLDNFGWGKYKIFDGNKYEENVILHDFGPSVEGQTVKMLIEVMNDTLIQKWPVDENWNLVEGHSIEKYIRVK